MILIVHILVAIASLVATGLAYISPSKSRLQTSSYLVALTLFSGTYLVITKPAHLVSACFTGIFYLGLVFAGIYASKKKLAKAAY